MNENKYGVLSDLRAFQNDLDLKKSLILRVDAHRAAAEIVPGPGYWDGSRGSLVGATIHANDAQAFERETGIAKGALAIAERLWSLSVLRIGVHREPWARFDRADIELLRKFPVAWLEAIPLGSNTRRVQRLVLISILERVRSEATSVPDLAELCELLGSLIRGHAGPADPEGGASWWRSLRNKAASLAASHREGSFQAALAEIAATAAWPDEPTAGTLPDLIEQYVNLNASDAWKELRWTVIEEETRRTLHAMRESILSDPEKRQTDALKMLDESLKERFPDFVDRRRKLEESTSLSTLRRLVELQQLLLEKLSSAIA